MDIAVIIPLYNGAPWISATLDAVLAQRVPPREIIVVDDGSTDGAPEIVEGYPQVRLLRSARNSGPVAARVCGLTHSTAPLVAFLDQDDPWHPAHLELTSRALREHPESAAAVGRQLYFTDDPCYELASGCEALDPWCWFPLDGAISTPSAVLLRREALATVGGWRIEYTGVADFHLWLRLAERTPLRLLRATTVGRRCHPRSFYAVQQADPLRYMRLRCAAASHAARMRLRTAGDDAPIHTALMDCVAFYGDVVLLVEAVLAEDHCSAALAVGRVAGIVERDAGHPGMELFGYLKQSLGARWPEVGAVLRACWPAERERSARMLEEHLLATRPALATEQP